ncbi:ABC transporter permease [Chitinophagaceae bacterium MMS25-I14]
MNVPFFIARRYLLKQKGAFSAFIIRLAIMATALSVAVMVLAIAFITGFKFSIQEKLFSFWGQVHVVPYSTNPSSLLSSSPIKENPALIQRISKLPHVTQMASYAVRPAIVQAHGHMEGVKLKGIRNGYHFSEGINFTGKPIDYSDSAYARQVILSQTTADRLNIQGGDSIILCVLEPGATFPRLRKVRVAGTFHTGMEEIDHDFAICDLRLLQRISNWTPDDISGYQVDVDNLKLTDTISEQIRLQYIEPPLTTQTTKDIFPNIFDWLDLQDVNAQIILSIMAIVAVINLAVALMILIVEHARMVGILKAQGMGQSSMQQVFLYHAALIATIGILLGNILSLGFCWLQKHYGILTLSESTYYMKQVPVRIMWWQVVLIDVATLILCVLCMWLPSLYIRRIQPARVLQFK